MALLEAIQHEFDTARNPQFFEDPKQIISHDLLRARVYTARHVALICYAMTVILVIAGWFIVRSGPWEAFVTSALVGCALFAIEVRAGALRLQDNSRHERAEEDLHWREMANGGGRENV